MNKKFGVLGMAAAALTLGFGAVGCAGAQGPALVHKPAVTEEDQTLNMKTFDDGTRCVVWYYEGSMTCTFSNLMR